jgi:hypothetical protein
MEYQWFVVSSSLLIGARDSIAECSIVFDDWLAELNYQKNMRSSA